MKYLAAALLAIAPLAAAAPAAAQQQSVEIAPADGHFTIRFPGAPQHAENNATTGDRAPIQIDQYSYTYGGMAFALVRVHYGADATAPVAKELDAYREQLLAGDPSLKLIAATPLDLNGVPGLEFLTSGAENAMMRTRVYIRGRTHYQVQTWASERWKDMPVLDAFQTSFRLLPE